MGLESNEFTVPRGGGGGGGRTYILGTTEVTVLDSNDDICWDCSYGKDQGVCGGISGETRKRLGAWTPGSFPKEIDVFF